MITWPMQERLTKVRNIMEERELDAIIITAWENLYYLTGVLPIQSKARLFDPPMPFLITTDGDPVFVPAIAYSTCVKLEHNYIKDVRPHSGNVWDVISSVLKERNMDSPKIGVEFKHLSAFHAEALRRKLPNATFNDCSDVVEALRMFKSTEEIDLIRKACNITDKVLEEAEEYLKVGATEIEVTREIIARCMKHGADGTSFYPQIFSGRRAFLFNITSSFEKKLQLGEIVLVDFGAMYMGYGCDTTRVFCLGKPSIEQVKAWEATKMIVEECVGLIKPGIKASVIHETAVAKLKQLGYEPVQRTTGHGIGLTNWERPSLSFDDHTTIQPGMTLAVEQGVYTPTWGVRLEENVVVTADGVENLFQFPLDIVKI